jgi:hypothetical protein
LARRHRGLRRNGWGIRLPIYLENRARRSGRHHRHGASGSNTPIVQRRHDIHWPVPLTCIEGPPISHQQRDGGSPRRSTMRHVSTICAAQKCSRSVFPLRPPTGTPANSARWPITTRVDRVARRTARATLGMALLGIAAREHARAGPHEKFSGAALKASRRSA